MLNHHTHHPTELTKQLLGHHPSMELSKRTKTEALAKLGQLATEI
jgi:hypothetical protein